METISNAEKLAHVESFLTFDAPGFFDDKELKLEEVIEDLPLKIRVRIIEDLTDYGDDYLAGDKPFAELNKGKTLLVALNPLVDNGNDDGDLLYDAADVEVTFDYKTAKAFIKNNDLLILTDQIRLSSANKQNVLGKR